MNLYLVHHANAVPAHVDPQRGLSPLGRRQADQVASEAKALGAAPSLIWHSGKLRSRQTAEAQLRRCNPMARFTMVRGLGPEDPTDWVADAIEAEDVDLMVIGHMPHIATLAAKLAVGSEMFPIHGMVWLERVGSRRYEERGRVVALDRFEGLDESAQA